MISIALLVLIGLSGAAAQGQPTRYTFTGNSMDVTSCEWTSLIGTPVNAWERVEGVGYICKAQAKPKYAGGVSSTNDGNCQYYCPASAFSTPVPMYGIAVFSSAQYTPPSIPNPYIQSPPSTCVSVQFKCDDTIDSKTPINSLSIALHGSTELQNCMLRNQPCGTALFNSTECNVCNMLKAIDTNKYPSKEVVLGLRGTPYACLLTYLGIGSVQQNGVCFKQLGSHCTAFQGFAPYCFNSDRKVAGITNYGTNDGPAQMWCYYTNWGQYRTPPYKLSPNSAPPNLNKCDGVIYAFSTIKQADGTPEFAGYTTGDWVVTEFEWNDNVQMPVITAAGKNVLLSIGGWNLGTAPWSAAAKTPASRAVFVRSAIALMQKYNFKGIDIDWEAPAFRGGGPEDIPNYGELAKLFRSELDKLGTYFFTTAVMVGHPTNENFNMGENHVYFDKVFLMTYDLFGGWDPTRRLCQTAWDIGTKCGMDGVSCPDPVDYFYLRYAINFYANLVPAHKLAVGLAFYGRGFMQTNGGAWAALTKKYSPQLQEDGLMGLAEIQNLYNLPCKINATQMCCIDTFVQGSDTIMMGWDSYDTMVMKIDATFAAFGIKTFFSWAFDYDTLPETPVHTRIIDYVHGLPSSGTVPQAAQLDPTYQIGVGPLVKCPGIQAVVNDIIFSGVAYKEFYSVAGFNGIVAAPVSEIAACTPGPPAKIMVISPVPPNRGVDINTFLPSSDPDSFLIGLDAAGKMAQYAPVVQDVCQEVNMDNFTILNYVKIDKDFYFTTPQMKDGFVLVPLGLHHLMSDYSYAVDFINFNTVCSNFQIDNIPSCITTACGGRPDCITSYASICSSAAALINDAKRSNQLMLGAFAELEGERMKAMMYEFSSADGALSVVNGGTNPQIFLELVAIGIAGAAAGVAAGALVISLQTQAAVEQLAARQDATRDAILQLGDQLVTISQKLDRNTQAVNQRVTDLQGQINDRFDQANKNFKTLSDGLQTLADVSNERFSVTLGYISWSQQMTSLTDQLTQGAIQMKHKVAMTKMCMMSLAQGTMSNCPSDLEVYRQHPGLRNVKTVQALRYYNKKLMIVNYLPRTFTAISPAVAYPLPVMRDGEVCWPAYKLSWVGGKVYDPLDCAGRYCQDPTPAEDWDACARNYTECAFVCSQCYKGMCYDAAAKEVSYSQQGEITAVFKVTGLPVFNRPITALNVSDIIKDIVFGNITIIQPISTNASLESIESNIQDILNGLQEYEDLYNSISIGGTSPRTILIILLVLAIFCTIVIVIALIRKIIRMVSGGGNREYTGIGDYNKRSDGYKRLLDDREA